MARAVPGVQAVLTGADIGPRRFGKVLYDQPVLAYAMSSFAESMLPCGGYAFVKPGTH